MAPIMRMSHCWLCERLGGDRARGALVALALGLALAARAEVVAGGLLDLVAPHLGVLGDLADADVLGGALESALGGGLLLEVAASVRTVATPMSLFSDTMVAAGVVDGRARGGQIDALLVDDDVLLRAVASRGGDSGHPARRGRRRRRSASIRILDACIAAASRSQTYAA